ncbi:hypothetical protein F5Y17DRAFT_39640 [Xylariaceae sp. FL0594]|nr:hypothetical protein F5Y17DRAFT_39640 [Xylariaceae sp. FL0594]
MHGNLLSPTLLMGALGLSLSLLLTTASPGVSAASSKPKDAILLSEVRSLTLRAGKETSHRRVSAIPQLRCVSSPRVCALHEVDVMRCVNQGSSYGGAEDVEWTCSASLPPELRLGSTDVVCEGYAGPDDPYVLRGSCGVEYRLSLTEAGERRFPDIANGGGGGGGGWFSGWRSGSGSRSGKDGSKSESSFANTEYGGEGERSDLAAWLFAIIFIGVLLWILHAAWTQAGGPGVGALRRRPGGWGGGGGGGGFDPGFGPGGGGGGYGGGSYGDEPPPPYSKNARPNNQESWRPGFWTGLASGAAAAYMAGNRGSRQQQQRHQQQEERRGFFGGGASGSSGWGSSPGSSSRDSGSGSGSVSSSRYSSTGFGSTSRR